MNAKAQSKLRFALNLIIAQAKWKLIENQTTKKLYKFKVNFITLTLSGKQRGVSDEEIKKKMLAPWIRNMRNVYGLRSYVWRAERQKNKNLHFHLTTDTYIDYAAIRDAWNLQQSKFHFIDEFRAQNKTEFPNSTDVKSVTNIQDLARYLVKYMAKSEKESQTIEGKVWDCSKNLKLKDRVVFEMLAEDFETLGRIQKEMPDRVKSNDHCTIINLNDQEMGKYLSLDKLRDYRRWLQLVYDSASPGRVSRI